MTGASPDTAEPVIRKGAAEPEEVFPAIDLLDLYERLFAEYGPQHWWPADDVFEMIVGALLVQNTAWTNAARAIARLKAADALSVDALSQLPVAELAELIRPSGFFNEKAKKLKFFVAHLVERHDGSLAALFAQEIPELRRDLLGIRGVGPETADSIILYGAGKPSFVVDAYTRRLFERLGILAKPTYQRVQTLCQRALPSDPQLFNEYHALIVRHARERCRARPRCLDCPLRVVCRFPSPASDTGIR